ncbi:hypothetical protein [Virgibacillus subterraneus]|uniref:hypothetical protein n=1 Tax=Virgibacillus subterraneus TaxID=621109 RepID=UPI00318460EC
MAGAIVLLILMCLDSELYDNKYGPNPDISIVRHVRCFLLSGTRNLSLMSLILQTLRLHWGFLF